MPDYSEGFCDWVAISHRSHHHRPTGDIEDDAGDPSCVIRGEIERRARDILRCSQSPERVGIDQRFLLRVGNPFQIALSQDGFRSDAVRADPERSGLRGHRLRQQPSTDARQPSSGISSSGAGFVKLPPALATRMSIGPSALST